MATTGFWPVKGRLKEVLAYAKNPDKTTDAKYLDDDLRAAITYAENSSKTDEQMYVSGINCSKHRAYEEMCAVKRKFHESGKVIAYHGYQSFEAGEVTPEEAHEIGKETARRMWGARFQVLVTTHLNTDNLHNHFVINATSFKDGTRFIAINDNVDSDEGENEIAPFKNIINEWYAKDISKKLRASYRVRGYSGEPLSQPPYGYIKSPENPKKWVIEPEAASIVQQVFQMALEGKSNEVIAKTLQEREVPIPMVYWQQKGIRRGGTPAQANPYRWRYSTIEKMLTQQEYCGDVINFKSHTISYKNKKRIEHSKENWAIFKDVHEPIIERKTFELVQTLIAKTKRRAPKKENGEKSIFTNFLYCADCGKKLWYHTNPRNKDIHYFSCSNYFKDTRGDCQTRHYVRADAVEQIVMMELRRLAKYLECYEDSFAQILAQKVNSDMLSEQKHLEKTLAKTIARNTTLTDLLAKIYEDNVSGKLSDEMFMQLSRKYEKEQFDNKAKIKEYSERLSKIDEMKQNKADFIKSIRKFMEIQTLTAPLLRELIDHIDVYEKEGTSKTYTQRIVIYYRFIGTLELPEEIEQESYIADTRQGVTVEYLSA